jgi:D-beta-D-heptose 7-phosphate kinase/D-beta-D-heptose 1-phosphate adenosyltransferase
MTVHDKTRILEAFAGKKILVIGDVMLDIYLWGDVRRISPEAPVPVVETRRRSIACGGAGNVAANLASLGASAFLASLAGDDAEGADLRGILAEQGIGVEGIVVDPNRPTTTKLRVMAHSQQVVRVDAERRDWVNNAARDGLLGWIEQNLSAMDGCVISDYGKGVVSSEVSQRVIELANRHGKPVVVDPKGLDYEKYRRATVVTPNTKEAGAVLGREIEDDHDVSDAARALTDLLGGSAVIVTQGGKGMTVYSDAEPVVQIPATAKNVYDVTGAGDTVVSALAVALAAGASLEQAARLANAAAGLVVGKLGTATVTVEELTRAVAD